MACVGAEGASVSVEAGDTSVVVGVGDGDPLGVTEVAGDVAGVVVVDGNVDGVVVVLLRGEASAVVEVVVKVEVKVETGLVKLDAGAAGALRSQQEAAPPCW